MPKYEVKQVADLEPGGVLAGKYRVERVLGAGGMGVVIAAHHLQLDEKVAIKFLLPQMLEDESAVVRFLREARAVVKIKSEHVARVFDVGTLDSGAPYMVMEFLEGGDLAKWIQERGPMPVDQAVEFVLQACVAVAEAHRLGIVHRDLKPANLFCVRRPDGLLSIKVLDFGISKVLRVAGAISDPNHATASLMGSPYYMSPEQMQASHDLDAGTDIWALGVILYELLTGHVPFSGVTITEIATKVATNAPPSIRQQRADLPPGLEAIVTRCLQKKRRNRYGDVAALAIALQKFGPRRAAAHVERIVGTLESKADTAGAPSVPSDRWDRPPGQRATDASAPTLEGALAPAGTIAPTGRTVPRGIRAKTGVVAATLVAFGAAGAGAALWARATHRQIRLATDSGGLSQAPAPSASWLSVPVESLPVAPPLESAPPAASSLASAVGERPAPAVRPRSSAPAQRRAAPAGSAGKDCRLVSFFDSEGNQHFKTNCDGKTGR